MGALHFLDTVKLNLASIQNSIIKDIKYVYNKSGLWEAAEPFKSKAFDLNTFNTKLLDLEPQTVNTL